MKSANTDAEQTGSPAGRGAAYVASLGAIVMIYLDLWVVTVAIANLSDDFASLPSPSWVLNAYAIMMSALFIVAGRAGDRIGNDLVFRISTATFIGASVLCAVTPNLTWLVVGRALQGVGAAGQLPTSVALLLAAVRSTSVPRRSGSGAPPGRWPPPWVR